LLARITSGKSAVEQAALCVMTGAGDAGVFRGATVPRRAHAVECLEQLYLGWAAGIEPPKWIL
jgi:hypothetical protein